jgi:ATP/maltotriose-dependent transcriptional regulator MalT
LAETRTSSVSGVSSRSQRANASELHISEATTKTHLVHIFAKLGVDARTAAVTAELEGGLLRLPSP